MKAVRIDAFGSAEAALRVVMDEPVPTPAPGEILVKVEATSVNPIDCAVREGYGAEFFLSGGLIRLPLIPGRDVAGTVEAVGPGVTTFRPGQSVYAGATNFATAEFIAIPAAWAAPMPGALSFVQAAALPYAALTAWSALVDTVGLTERTTVGRRVVVPRGAGGVGSVTIQLMKAWGAHVASICSTRNVELVRSLGADEVVDYLRADFTHVLADFDVAFDTAFDTEAGLLSILKTGADATYVSIVSPRLRLIDQYGLEEGAARGDELLRTRKVEQALLGRRYDWAFMQPNGKALASVGALVEAGLIRPLIDRVYPIEDIVEAHRYCETRQAQGKIIVQIAR